MSSRWSKFPFAGEGVGANADGVAVILFPIFLSRLSKAGVGLNSAECNEDKTENIIQRKVKKFQDPIPAFAGMTRENAGMTRKEEKTKILSI